MMEVRLHGAIWRDAQERREEWKRAIEDINRHNTMTIPGQSQDAELSLEIVRLPSGQFLLRAYKDVFDRLHEARLNPDALDEVFADYAQTIRRMAHVHKDAPVRGFESLDYAKKVVHNEAAALMMDALYPPVQIDQSDARRLFTLLFLIGGDLPEQLVRFHQFH